MLRMFVLLAGRFPPCRLCRGALACDADPTRRTRVGDRHAVVRFGARAGLAAARLAARQQARSGRARGLAAPLYDAGVDRVLHLWALSIFHKLSGAVPHTPYATS